MIDPTCPMCGRHITIHANGKIERHNRYDTEVRSPEWGKPCPRGGTLTDGDRGIKLTESQRKELGRVISEGSRSTVGRDRATAQSNLARMGLVRFVTPEGGGLQTCEPTDAGREAYESTVPMAEIAHEIRGYLKRFEADPKINAENPRYGVRLYYGANAWVDCGKVRVCYVTYHGSTLLARPAATAYLAWLREGNVGAHTQMQSIVRREKAATPVVETIVTVSK